MPETTLKKALEEGITDCNYILRAWANHKPKLLNQQDVRGLVIFHIQKAINRAFNYKQLREMGRFTRIYPADVQWHDTEHYLTSIYFSVMVTGTLASQVQSTLASIDLVEMARLAINRGPSIETSTLETFNLKSLETIKF